MIVHNNGAPTEEELRVLMENFKCNNLVGVYHSENLGYSAGAIESVDQALQGGWFDGYCRLDVVDWIKRNVIKQ